MFGALRRLLQSGDIRSVLQESRRSFSDIAAVLGTPTNRARQSALMDTEFVGEPLMDTGFVGEGYYNPAYESGSYFGYDLPGGGIAFRDQGTGAISTERFNRGDSSNFPIQAPYEGFRVWPYGSRPAFEEPRWRGAGRSSYRVPGVDARLYDDGLGSPSGYDYGSIDFRPYNPMPIAQMNVPRAFGGFDPFYSNNPSRTGRIGRTITFDEIMAAQSSLIPPRPIPDFNVPF